MKIDLKIIHIGSLIKVCVEEKDLETERICNFIKCSEKELEEMYKSKSLDADVIMKWSKLLGYDFFRVYTQHLILFAPPGKMRNIDLKTTHLPKFRKNIYTKEVIDFILEMMETGKKTKQQIIEEYNIPKTTLYRWIEKYSNPINE